MNYEKANQNPFWGCRVLLFRRSRSKEDFFMITAKNFKKKRDESFILRIPLQLFLALSTPMEIAVFFSLFSFTNNGKNYCFAGLREISKRANCSKDTTTRTIKKLIGKKIVEVSGHRTVKGGKTPKYTIIIPESVRPPDTKGEVSDHRTLRNFEVSDTAVEVSDTAVEVSDLKTSRNSSVKPQQTKLLKKQLNKQQFIIQKNLNDGMENKKKESRGIKEPDTTKFFSKIKTKQSEWRQGIELLKNTVSKL